MRTFISVLVAAFLILSQRQGFSDNTWVYTVQLSATAEASPARITLHWKSDDYGAASYTVYRKTVASADWGPGVQLSGWATSYVDSSVAAAQAYEYRVVKQATLGYTGYGYIYCGIQAPLVDTRGKVILVVESNATAPLGSEISQLVSNLAGDGWQVISKLVSSNDTPASMRALIKAEYDADKSGVRAVFLLGRVPVFLSGSVNWDTHGARPVPADAYYGDMDGDWSASPSFLPSDVELMVGRVDFAGMPGSLGKTPWPSETELLRAYLNKNHAWRHNRLSAQRRALMGNRRGDEEGEATAASGYRHFDAFVGPANTVEADTGDFAPLAQRWISHLSAGSWLWAYGCGGGQPLGISNLGSHGVYHDVYGVDFRDLDAKGMFVLFFGSYVADWHNRDNIMRAVLAAPNGGLACGMAGRPHWFLHHLALGEPVGYGVRLSQNNSTMYNSQINDLTRVVYVALMGDPTLRMDVVAPPANLAVTASGNSVRLQWTASSDPVQGYHIYRAPGYAGPFTRMTSIPVATREYTHDGAAPGQWHYQVRAVKLENYYSGSYFNASQGISAAVNVVGGGTTTNHVQVRIQMAPSGIVLSWNGDPGDVFHVEATDDILSPNWAAISGPVSSDTSDYSWVDENGTSLPRGFYRVVSP